MSIIGTGWTGSKTGRRAERFQRTKRPFCTRVLYRIRRSAREVCTEDQKTPPNDRDQGDIARRLSAVRRARASISTAPPVAVETSWSRALLAALNSLLSTLTCGRPEPGPEKRALPTER